MKSKSFRRYAGLQSTPSLALITAITAFATVNAFAVTYQWNGATDGQWSTASNWATTGTDIVAGPAPTAAD